jgi:hypothetical protein
MYSPDGLWWWNGAAWVPAPRWQTRYESTPWTRKLQLSVIALQVVAVVVALTTFPSIIDSVFTSSPAVAADPQTADAMRQVIGPTIAIVIVLSVVLEAVIVLGVLKLWRWLYWYLMISWGLGLLAIPANLSSVFLGNGPFQYPTWYRFVDIPILAATAAIFVWMLIAYRRYGTWARRKIVEPA